VQVVKERSDTMLMLLLLMMMMDTYAITCAGGERAQ
jgi:hypothetical protein